jgi:dipeptidyl aminopeptidase/acylaminoacyl peptidase
MKRHTLKLSAIALVLLMSYSRIAYGQLAQVPRYKFTYATVNRDEPPQLHIISFTEEQPETERRDIETPDGYALYSVQLNKSGDWLAVISRSASDYRISLTNMLNNATSDIFQGVIYRPVNVSPDLSYLVWSADGHKFAFVEEQSERNIVWVYNINTQSTIRLAELPTLRGLSMAWSADAQMLAISTDQCKIRPCTITISIYRTSNSELVHKLDASQIASATIGAGVCGFQWSPNGRYLSYSATCSLQYPDPSQGVWVWDLVTDQVKQVVTSWQGPALKLTLGLYESFWPNSDTLLIGAAFSNDGDPDQSFEKTFRYRPSAGALDEIYNEATSFSWSAQLTNEYFAYRKMTGLDYYFTPQETDLTISKIEADQFTEVKTLDDLCEPLWSIDGRFLAASKRNPKCTSRITAFTLVDMETNLIRVYPIPSSYRRIQPLGWVEVPAVIPTPTVVPTITPTPPPL